MAEPLTYPGTDVQIKVLGTKSRSADPRTLCASKHQVVIGLTPPPTADAPATPFETSIVVAFTAMDTSGAGYIGDIFDPIKVGQGIEVFVTDSDKYVSTIEAGKIGATRKLTTGTTGEKIEGGLYLTVANSPIGKGFQTASVIIDKSGVGSMISSGASSAKKGASWLGEKTGLWAENFQNPQKFRATDYWGTTYHFDDAQAHKIRIEIFNTPPNGTRRQVYDSELAGSSDDSKGYILPSFAYFAIDAPGKWEVFTESIASGTCGTPKLKYAKSFTVPVPPEPPEEESEMIDTDGDGVAETIVSTQSSGGTAAVGSATSVPTVGLETIIGGTLLTGVFLYALLRR